MRKESKIRSQSISRRNTDIAGVQRYHACSDYHTNYAYAGFKANKYYTSDRTIKLDSEFKRPDGKPLKGYGLEIEIGSSINSQTVLAEVLDKIIFDKFPADLFKMQNDSSLRGASTAECITQVMTREFVRNHYPEFKQMFNIYFPAFGIESNLSCGMHANISLACFGAAEKTQAECVRKLYYIINHHFNAMCVMLHRDRNSTYYCDRMTCDKTYCKSMELTSFASSHGVSFNLGHYSEGRIEIRLVGNQPTYAAYRNTMETIFHLVDAVKRLSWDDCDDLVKIFAGCNQHVFDRFTMLRSHPEIVSGEQIEALRVTIRAVDFE